MPISTQFHRLRVPLSITALLAALTLPAFAQYTDNAAIERLGGPQTFADRRAALAKELKTGRVILFARTEESEDSHYREDNDFYYFSGIQDPGAILMFNVETGVTILFEPQMSKGQAQFLGKNLLAMEGNERKARGFESVYPLSELDVILGFRLQGKPGADVWIRMGYPDRAVAARLESAAAAGALYSHPYGLDLSPELARVRLLRDRYPMVNFRDVTPFVERLRNIKTGKELEILWRNGKLSAVGDRQAIAHSHAGMYQYAIEARAYAYFYSHGTQGVAYPAIVGFGENINTWHYFSTRNKIEPMNWSSLITPRLSIT